MNEDFLMRQMAVIMARISEFEKASERLWENHERRLTDLERPNKDTKIVSMSFVNLNKANGEGR